MLIITQNGQVRQAIWPNDGCEPNQKLRALLCPSCCNLKDGKKQRAATPKKEKPALNKTGRGKQQKSGHTAQQANLA